MLAVLAVLAVLARFQARQGVVVFRILCLFAERSRISATNFSIRPSPFFAGCAILLFTRPTPFVSDCANFVI